MRAKVDSFSKLARKPERVSALAWMAAGFNEGRAEGWTADRLVREYALRVLERNRGNLSRTARELGLDFKTLKKKIGQRRDPA